DRIRPPAELPRGDQVVVTATYKSRALRGPIRLTGQISPLSPLVFRYPQDPGDPGGQATVSAVGVIGGRPVTARDLPISPGEESVYLLVGGGGIQLVGRQAVLPKSDGLAGRLLGAGARPAAAVEGKGAAQPEAEPSADVDLAVDLVPQPTDVSCW